MTVQEKLQIDTRAQEAMTRLFTVLADTKYRLGQHLANCSWMGPVMEASVATSAMAQGELGRARLLYWLIEEMTGQAAEDLPVDAAVRAAGDALPEIKPEPETWVELIAAIYAIKTATRVVLQGLLDAPDPALHRRLKKMDDEEHYEILYAEGWIEDLLADTGSLPARVRAALAHYLPPTRAWLAAGETAVLTAAGLLPAGFNLGDEFAARVEEFARSVGTSLTV